MASSVALPLTTGVVTIKGYWADQAGCNDNELIYMSICCIAIRAGFILFICEPEYCVNDFCTMSSRIRMDSTPCAHNEGLKKNLKIQKE